MMTFLTDTFGPFGLIIVIGTMAIILIGVGKSKGIDKWLKSDTAAIEELKEKVSSFSKKVERNPSLTDLMIMIALAFGTVSLAHLCAGYLSEFFSDFVGEFKAFLSY